MSRFAVILRVQSLLFCGETDLLLQLRNSCMKTLVILVVTVTGKLLDPADAVNISVFYISSYSANLLHLLF